MLWPNGFERIIVGIDPEATEAMKYGTGRGRAWKQTRVHQMQCRSKAKPCKGDIKANTKLTVDLKKSEVTESIQCKQTKGNIGTLIGRYFYKDFRPDQSQLNLIWVHLTLGSRWKLQCLVRFSSPLECCCFSSCPYGLNYVTLMISKIYF